MVWHSVVTEAYGKEPAKRLLGGLKVKNVKTEEVTDLEVVSQPDPVTSVPLFA
jgi:thioredoxin reductase (NADPH)